MELDLKVKDCVGCGYCCVKTPCWVAQRIHGYVKECPELLWNGERHTCRLMTLPDPLGFDFRKELHAGAGCCASLFNTWRTELKDRRPVKKEEKYSPFNSIFQAFLTAIGREMISGDAIILACYGFKDLMIKNGVSKEDADSYMKQALHYISENRSRMTKDFLG